MVGGLTLMRWAAAVASIRSWGSGTSSVMFTSLRAKGKGRRRCQPGRRRHGGCLYTTGGPGSGSGQGDRGQGSPRQHVEPALGVGPGVFVVDLLRALGARERADVLQ